MPRLSRLRNANRDRRDPMPSSPVPIPVGAHNGRIVLRSRVSRVGRETRPVGLVTERSGPAGRSRPIPGRVRQSETARTGRPADRRETVARARPVRRRARLRALASRDHPRRRPVAAIRAPPVVLGRRHLALVKRLVREHGGRPKRLPANGLAPTRVPVSEKMPLENGSVPARPAGTGHRAARLVLGRRPVARALRPGRESRDRRTARTNPVALVAGHDRERWP